jgi:hypothetical protein
VRLEVRRARRVPQGAEACAGARDDSRDWLTGLLAGTALGAIMFDEAYGRMMRAVPLVRFSRFPGAPFSEITVKEAVKRFARPRGDAG